MTSHQPNPDTGRPIGSMGSLRVPRIDAHQHYWSVSREDYGWAAAGLPALDRDFLPDLLEAELIDSEIDRSVLVQVLHTRAETSWLLGLAGQYGSIAGVVGWVDLTEDPDQIAQDLTVLAADPKFVGVRHLVHEEPVDEWLIRSDVQCGLEVLRDAAIPFDLLLRPKHLRLVPILSERLPTLRMVIDHIAKPDLDGLVIIPRAVIQEVLDAAAKLALAEKSVAICLAAGESTLAIYGLEDRHRPAPSQPTPPSPCSPRR